MIGDVPYDPMWSADQLAKTLKVNENFSYARLTALHMQAEPPKNIGTFVQREPGSKPLGHILIVDSGAAGPDGGERMFSSSIFVAGEEADVDVWRLAAAQPAVN